MGNANGHIHNDTDTTVVMYSYNYSDAYRTVPFGTYTIQPRATQEFEAAADARGLIVATGKHQAGKHHHLANGTTLSVTHVVNHGDGNPSHDSAHRAVIGLLGIAADCVGDGSW